VSFEYRIGTAKLEIRNNFQMTEHEKIQNQSTSDSIFELMHLAHTSTRTCATPRCRAGIDRKSSRDCVDARLMSITRAFAIEGYGMLKYKDYMISDRGKDI
jgi:hypothetical protein